MARLQDVILRGLRADQPDVTDVGPGTLYFVTDEGVTERVSDDGASWETYSGVGGTPPPASGSAPNTFLVNGGQVIWESAYTFRVSAATYYINGVLYESAEDTVSLSAAHGSLDRIDAIVLDTASAADKITGTAASTPSEPTVDPAQYLKLAIVLVEAASSAPVDVVNETVYAENVGTPTEWAWTSSDASLVVSSTNNPHAGTKDIEGTAVVAGAYVKGINTSTIDPSDYDYLLMFIRSKAAWNNSRGLLVTLRNAGVLVGAAAQVRRTGTFGFDSTNTSGYQQVAIPIVNFAVPLGEEIDEVRIEDFGGSIGFYIDDITFQADALTPVGGWLTQAQADALYAPLVHASRHGDGGADEVIVRRQITVVIDGGGTTITTGYKAWVSMPHAGTIKKARLLADQTGSIVIDIWKDTYANYPPTIADTITASAKPTLSSATKSEDSTLTGWTVNFNAGDIFGFNVDSVSTVEKVALTLEYE
jgi:hypothetical protein